MFEGLPGLPPGLWLSWGQGISDSELPGSSFSKSVKAVLSGPGDSLGLSAPRGGKAPGLQAIQVTTLCPL